MRYPASKRIDSGDDSEGETPVPIPNTEVKPFSADGTWGETPWESRSLPEFKYLLTKGTVLLVNMARKTVPCLFSIFCSKM